VNFAATVLFVLRAGALHCNGVALHGLNARVLADDQKISSHVFPSTAGFMLRVRYVASTQIGHAVPPKPAEMGVMSIGACLCDDDPAEAVLLHILKVLVVRTGRHGVLVRSEPSSATAPHPTNIAQRTRTDFPLYAARAESFLSVSAGDFVIADWLPGHERTPRGLSVCRRTT
jgi:hypothetical protein